MILIVTIYALIISFSHYYTKNFCLICKSANQHIKFISFSAGIALTYLLLDLLPDFSKKVLETNKFLFFSMLIGFVMFLLVEKHTKKHTINVRKNLELEEIISFNLYHLIIGVILVSFSSFGIFKVTLFLIPVLGYTLIQGFLTPHSSNTSIKLITSTPTLIGVILGYYLNIGSYSILNLSLLGFVIGALLHIIMRHSIPGGKKGEPAFFILGVAIYSILIIINWGII